MMTRRLHAGWTVAALLAVTPCVSRLAHGQDERGTLPGEGAAARPAAATGDDPPAGASFGIPGLVSNLEFKTLEEGIGGIDFRFELERDFEGYPLGESGNPLRLVASSRGFVADGAENGVNSIITELRLTGQHFSMFGRNQGSFTNWSQKEPLFPDLDGAPVARGVAMRQILGRLEELAPTAEDGTSTKPPEGSPEGAEYDDLRLRRDHLDDFSARFLEFDVHVRHEADQKLDEDQWAFGVGFTTDAAILDGKRTVAGLLDAPFGLFRPVGSTWRPQHPRFYFGYDYVSDSDVARRMALTDDDSFSRLTFQAAWLTQVFETVLVRVSWELYWEIDAAQAVKNANEDFTSFVEITASLPVNDEKNTHIILKYVDGDLPSTLENTSELSAGFSFTF